MHDDMGRCTEDSVPPLLSCTLTQSTDTLVSLRLLLLRSSTRSNSALLVARSLPVSHLRQVHHDLPGIAAVLFIYLFTYIGQSCILIGDRRYDAD